MMIELQNETNTKSKSNAFSPSPAARSPLPPPPALELIAGGRGVCVTRPPCRVRGPVIPWRIPHMVVRDPYKEYSISPP